MHEMCFTCPFWDLRYPVLDMKPRLRIAVVEQWNDEQMVIINTEEPETYITVRNVADVFRIRREWSLYAEWMVGCSKESWKSDVGNVLFIYLFTLYSFIRWWSQTKCTRWQHCVSNDAIFPAISTVVLENFWQLVQCNLSLEVCALGNDRALKWRLFVS